MTAEQAQSWAQAWTEAWNSHDLDRILDYYDDSVELISPVAARLMGDPDGKVQGKARVREYFHAGLMAYPGLRFELENVFLGLGSVVLLCKNQKHKDDPAARTAEFMELSPAGKITRVRANYSV